MELKNNHHAQDFRNCVAVLGSSSQMPSYDIRIFADAHVSYVIPHEQSVLAHLSHLYFRVNNFGQDSDKFSKDLDILLNASSYPSHFNVQTIDFTNPKNDQNRCVLNSQNISTFTVLEMKLAHVFTILNRISNSSAIDPIAIIRTDRFLTWMSGSFM